MRPSESKLSSLRMCQNLPRRSLHRLRGDKGIRTLDPLLAGQVLSQLSYTPLDPAAAYSSMPSPA